MCSFLFPTFVSSHYISIPRWNTKGSDVPVAVGSCRHRCGRSRRGCCGLDPADFDHLELHGHVILERDGFQDHSADLVTRVGLLKKKDLNLVR